MSDSELFGSFSSHTLKRSKIKTDKELMIQVHLLIFLFFFLPFKIFQKKISFKTTNISRYIKNCFGAACLNGLSSSAMWERLHRGASFSLRLVGMNKHQLVVCPFHMAEQDFIFQEKDGNVMLIPAIFLIYEQHVPKQLF